jgi:hypothetical protein
MLRTYVEYSRFLLALLIFGCNQTKTNPTPVDKTQIKESDVTISVLRDSSSADGVSTNALQFKGGPSVDSFYSAVVFAISPNGLFSNDSTQIMAPLDINGQATVYAFSRMPGYTTVTATVGGVTVQTQTLFMIAWPDEVLITTDSTFLTPLPGIWTGVTATLLRNLGRVSPGVFVRLYDSTMVDSVIGAFEGPAVSDTSGMVTRQYFITDTSYHGLVFINGAVTSPSGTVEGTGRLQIR